MNCPNPNCPNNGVTDLAQYAVCGLQPNFPPELPPIPLVNCRQCGGTFTVPRQDYDKLKNYLIAQNSQFERYLQNF